TYKFLQRYYAANQPFRVEAVAFYRGRADDDGVATVNVLPTPPTDLVTIQIGQSKELWAQRYPDVDPRSITDQFQDHPNRGYMHLGGSLSYILTFRNQFPKELKVKYLIELTDPANPQPNKGEVRPNKEVSLGPYGSPRSTYTIPPNAVSLNKDKK